MKEEIIERKLKAQLDYFKIYAVFIIGLTTGNVNLIKNFLEKELQSTFVMLCIGSFMFIVICIMFIQSIITINKLTK